MKTTRRDFIKLLGAAGAAVATRAEGATAKEPADDAVGVLMDISKCIGCRLCEHACQKAHGLNPPPVETFQDKSVFSEVRRPGPRLFTVVNRHPNPYDPVRPFFTKLNCLHCVDASCVSACIVGALQKTPAGPVLYNPGKCMGCRYCMVACPFEMPAYEYDEPLEPRVRKCDLCANLVPQEQEVPACVAACPAEALTYGPRAELLQMAHATIEEHPGTYVDHVYGEHEVGGTSWLYLSRVPFTRLGFADIGVKAPPRLTESIQHGIFKNFGPPLMLYGLLGVVMWLNRPGGEEEPAMRLEAGAWNEPAGDDTK